MGPADSIKQAMIALLVLAARYPDEMRRLLQEMEQFYRQRTPDRKKSLTCYLSEYCLSRALNPNDNRHWIPVSEAVKNPNLLSQDLTIAEFGETQLQLVSSFSFIGESESVTVASAAEELAE